MALGTTTGRRKPRHDPRLSFLFAGPIAGFTAGQAHEADRPGTRRQSGLSKSWPLGFRAIAERMAAARGVFLPQQRAAQVGHIVLPSTGKACLSGDATPVARLAEVCCRA